MQIQLGGAGVASNLGRAAACPRPWPRPPHTYIMFARGGLLASLLLLCLYLCLSIGSLRRVHPLNSIFSIFILSPIRAHPRSAAPRTPHPVPATLLFPTTQTNEQFPTKQPVRTEIMQVSNTVFGVSYKNKKDCVIE